MYFKSMPREDKEEVLSRYTNRFNKYGYSPKTLGWDKGKQDLRYKILFEEFDIKNRSILDIGCGFGDANKNLQLISKEYHYLGIDIVDKLIQEANKIYNKSSNIQFITGDFLEIKFSQTYDIVVASGIFNFKLQHQDNYDFIYSVIKKAYSLCKDGIAFDFLSNKVDFTYEHTFHSDPSKILDIGYQFSRNIILKNSYMPFEFSLHIFKDDSFSKEDTIFNRYKNEI